jgi:hypothetical protein
MNANAILLGPTKVDVVPKGQNLQTLAPQIVMTRFSDTGIYHPRLMEKILAEETTMRAVAPTQSRFLGGQKLYHIDDWNYPEVELLNARVASLFRMQTKAPAAHIDHSWINVYRRHDYIAPHAHRRTPISAVYCVAEGDIDEEDPLSGSFCFVDPRLDNCCQERQYYMTTPWHIRLHAGSMLMFPSQLTHMVTPYQGESPRITIAWNLGAERVPGTPYDARINDGSAAKG